MKNFALLFFLCIFNTSLFGMEMEIDQKHKPSHIYLNGMQQIITALQKGRAYPNEDTKEKGKAYANQNAKEPLPSLPKNVLNLIFY